MCVPRLQVGVFVPSAPFGAHFFQLNHVRLFGWLAPARGWRAQFVSRLAVGQQFGVSHIAQTLAEEFEARKAFRAGGHVRSCGEIEASGEATESYGAG